MEFFENIKGWIRRLTEIGVLLIALGIVLQILFGSAVPFLGGDIIGNLLKLISSLGDKGLVGLVAIGIILLLFDKKH
jgi:hypothetical protein